MRAGTGLVPQGLDKILRVRIRIADLRKSLAWQRSLDFTGWGRRGKSQGTDLPTPRLGDVRRPESLAVRGLLHCLPTGAETALSSCSLGTATTCGPPVMKPKPL